MKKEEIKIFIADDHDIIRQGLKRILSFENDFSIIGEAKNGSEALDLIKNEEPDVLLLDLNMPVMNGIDVLQDIKEKNSDIKVILLTVENDKKTIHQAIDIGADGYMLKDSAGEEIINAVKTVFQGEKYIDKSLVSMLFGVVKNKKEKVNSVIDCLSKREVEVLLKISKGMSNKEIGNDLYLSEKTVKNYATNIFRKINAPDRVHATILAIKNNIEEYYKSRFSSED